MENKKLLNFLLKDLTEIDELFSEKNKSEFDQLEIEFIQTRLKGAIKLVQILNERESLNSNNDSYIDNSNSLIERVVEQVVEEDNVENEVIIEETALIEKLDDKKAPEVTYDEVRASTREEENEETVEEAEKFEDVELVEEFSENADKRLGEVFIKDKSVNDLLTATNNLDHILSNRPVKSIQTAIGINDRFQYIRELFEGKADDFVKAVEELDSMNNLKEAVQFLQVNYKWKKNDTSLKFINLIKRRFPNE
ncbi:MAG: hypothetical protein JXR61_05665 [Prolixibacteraceae bacterium]|nr:hypothetical protein [Prolixibacteraceae bacterium]